MDRFNRVTLAVFLPCIVALSGCQDLAIHDTQSLLDPHLKRSEVLGLVAGFGTTFAAMPDLRLNASRVSPGEAAIPQHHEEAAAPPR